VNSKILGFRVGRSYQSANFSSGKGVKIVMKNAKKARDPPYRDILRSLHAGEQPTAVVNTEACSFLDMARYKTQNTN
jgi:hypothetical protein